MTEDTIEEMDEDDLDSLNTLVRQGFDIGTDNFSYRQVKNTKRNQYMVIGQKGQLICLFSSFSSEDKEEKPKMPTAVTSL